ncbi:protein-tyrosine phosphatase [Kibdelosporangium banguiense]|uniref:Protein-tyrosine phosphatase n=1 Tax=Kibdelosporangium banguiense TaxID=1365924 RepID=A0ABS4U260_9PSEU|nr:dual specificity protein phosphatase family protein [Kibdelosporangium banguiense]MBP2330726.1 protein-tyrosine phosphatase [Kibdelosporangium banguiense]
MRTRQKDRDVPGPGAPWNEIRPGLWMGGHHWTDPAGELQPAIVTDEFDLVISLYTRSGHGPPATIEHRVAEIPDAALTAFQIDQVRLLALLAATATKTGRTTLVRCHAGYNRSGLVVAQTLIELGYEPRDAIQLIRQRRSPWALHNALFEEYLLTGLDIAHLLVGLES